MSNIVPDGVATAAPNQPYITTECFAALLGELYERIGLLEGRTDDLERTRGGQDRRITALLEEVARLKLA